MKHSDQSGKSFDPSRSVDWDPSVPYGENLAWCSGAAASDTLAVKSVQGWYDEINDYSYDTCDTTNGNQIGHFTQVTKNFLIL